MDELSVLKIITERLNSSNIPYMVSGSVAMNYYAQPRMTRDVDIIIDLNFSNIGIFCNLFQDDFHLDKKMIEGAVINKSMFNIIHSKELIKIDFILYKKIGYRQIEFERRKKLAVGDFAAYFVSIEDLILSKLIWAKPSHSEMQLKDVKALLKQDVDMEYVKKWADGLGVLGLLEEVLHE